MPEGDTIWRTADQLRPRLAGKRLTRAAPEKFQRLVGSTVTDVSPNGKHLLVHFDNGLVLHSHMRMTGFWHVYRPGEPWRRPAHLAKVVLENEDTVAVLFNAPVVELRREKVVEHDLAHLGPDILAPALDLDEILKRARKAERQALGELLLNQRVAAGIGNIYKCESLWRLKLDPWMQASALDDAALGKLYLTARTPDAGRSQEAPADRGARQGGSVLPALLVADCLPLPGRPTTLHVLLREMPAVARWPC